MVKATYRLTSTSPYSQQTLQTTPNGNVCIPPGSIKRCVADAVRLDGGKPTSVIQFEAAFMCCDPLVLNVTADNVTWEEHRVLGSPMDGYGHRIEMKLPTIRNWSGLVEFLILDDRVSEDVFSRHIEKAGQCIGVGKLSSRFGGPYGRFAAELVSWK